MNATQITRRENVQKQMHLDSLKFMGYLKLNVPKTVAMMRSALSYTTDRTSATRWSDSQVTTTVGVSRVFASLRRTSLLTPGSRIPRERATISI